MNRPWPRFKQGIYERMLRVLGSFFDSRPQGRRWLYRHIPYYRAVTAAALGGREGLEADPYRPVRSAATPRTRAREREGAVFITGRFRSGSTLLWNVFRDLPGFTAYYEPLNERRWFLRDARGNGTDRTHVGVDDYWREYDGLEELDRVFRADWNDRNLLMPERAWDPGMTRYLDTLILRAASRPVLQFNRMDFRLPWLRHHYPRAKLIHLYRDPREQWLSVIQSKDNCGPGDDFASMRKRDFFYLRRWCRDLAPVFPFLEEGSVAHPYELHYYLWRLSFAFGRRHADLSIPFESIVREPRETLEGLFSAVDVDTSLVSGVLPKVEPVSLDRWKGYAEDQWFADIEGRCEAVMQDYFERTGAVT